MARDHRSKSVKESSTSDSAVASSAVSQVANVLTEVRSGLCGSLIAEAALFPIDTLKLQKQVHGGSLVSIFKKLITEQGVGGFYRGLYGRLFQTVTSNVGFFIWQTLLKQAALERLSAKDGVVGLSTAQSLVLNMLAQCINRTLTTPIDVVANINQTDPHSRGFVSTFIKIAREGGRDVLWAGLGVSLLLSLNPALMFTCVDKITMLIKATLRKNEKGPLAATDMFWVSGLSKTIATLLTYPLIRAKVMMQTNPTGDTKGLWGTLRSIRSNEGFGGFYQGVWIMSYKTVIFNALMMAIKQKFVALEMHHVAVRKRSKTILAGPWRERVELVHGNELPWEAAIKSNATIIYVDGFYSFLHVGHQCFLQEASKRGDHLVVGVHEDEVEGAERAPGENFDARLERVRSHFSVSSILKGAPWVVTEELIQQLGISKVLSGSLTKLEDTAPSFTRRRTKENIGPQGDPYAICKQLGFYEEVESIHNVTETSFIEAAAKVLFSNVDASIDWRVLVNKDQCGANPSYSRPQARSM